MLVTDLKAQDALVAQLSTAFDNAVVVDRRNNPSHGYRAVHLVVTIKNRMVEIQVRTSLQQFWAVLSEKVADKFGNAIKYGGGEVQARQELESLSSSISKIELLRTARNLDPEILVSIADVEDHVRLLGTDLLAYLGVNE